MSPFSPTFSAALARDNRYLKAQLPDAVGLTLEEIGELILAGYFPVAQCHPTYGPSWSRKEVDAWGAELSGNIDLAECLEIVLGYRRSGWSRSND